MTRPAWDDIFAYVAGVMAQRSTCSRRQVGAVLVKDNRIVATGYNGSPPGAPHCIDGACPRGRLSYDEVPAGADYNAFPCIAVHAELNAIIRAGYDRANGGTLYVTDKPCQQCWNAINAAGITVVKWPDMEI